MPGAALPGSGTGSTPTEPFRAPLPPPSPYGKGRGGVVWLLLAAGAGAVAIAVVALVLVLNDQGSDDTAGVAEPTTAATAATDGTSDVGSGSITTSTLTGPTAAPVVPAAPTTDGAATAPPIAAPTRGRVARSCGARGNGDCFLSRRASPSSDATELGRLSEGDPIDVQCTMVGESVTASALGRSTRIWARTDDGSFVSMAFVDAPGFDPFADSHPC